MKKPYLLVGVLFLLSACASVMSGTKQNIRVTSTPDGAHCDFYRINDTTKKEEVIAQLVTPGMTEVEKTKYDITVKCNLDGYMESSAFLESGTEGSTVGNIILGGGIGWAVDSARGADNKYPEAVHINMTRIGATPSESTAPIAQ